MLSSVSAGGLWAATLVNATRWQMVAEDLPLLTREYMLNMPSAGASEKAHVDWLRSVNGSLFSIAAQRRSVYKSDASLQ